MFNEKHEQLLRALAASYVPVARPACGGEPVLLCPACQDENVRPVAARVAPAGRAPGELIVTAAGLHLDPNVPPKGRGVMITLAFMCEHNHEFEYELALHKGTTSIRRRIGIGLPHGVTADTIWRD